MPALKGLLAPPMESVWSEVRDHIAHAANEVEVLPIASEEQRAKNLSFLQVRLNVPTVNLDELMDERSPRNRIWALSLMKPEDC